MGFGIVFGASEEKQRAFLAKHPEFGTFEERQKRFIAEICEKREIKMQAGYRYDS